MERWEGRVALVTGATSGIGTAIAVELVKRKMKVIGCGRQISKLQVVANQLSEKYEGHLEPVQCDVRKESDINNMFNLIESKYGGLDVCINNAGLYKDAPLLSGSTECWREIMEESGIKVSSALNTHSETRYWLTPKRPKRAVYTDSDLIRFTYPLFSILRRHCCDKRLSGHRLPTTNIAFYPATKFAVRTLTEGIRVELRQKKSKIRIAEISPDVVETEIFSRGGGKEFSDKILNSLKVSNSVDMSFF
ncbi:hypothetical protein LSH36_1171g00039 [Paralvinella palmiformis]|uniref:Dehydrogenase/reductase SDR family member 11 n=1 Tax=Paralvinella palmiformis TaxID=53620 RepID=A0AAD9IUR3_9ANNE|nr:hypothetical protein LSH36_1171g00039 [Paralvinella palmiformis]